MSGLSIYARFADALKNDWRAKARKEQLAPEGDWTIWLMLMGRGAGKSYASAQHIREIADSGKVVTRSVPATWERAPRRQPPRTRAE